MFKRWMIVLTALVCISQTLPGAGIRAEPAQAEAQAPTFDGISREEQLKALKDMNRIRRGMGLSELALDPALTEAAIRHAGYADAHFHRDDSRDFGREEPGQPHYSGTTPAERAAAAGYDIDGDTDIRESIYMEYRTYDEFDLAVYLRSMSLFHASREVMTNPNTTAVGIARVGKATVMTGAVERTEAKGPTRIGVYPYDGMQEASIGFYEPRDASGFEGMTITVQVDRIGVDEIEASLERLAGQRRGIQGKHCHAGWRRADREGVDIPHDPVHVQSVS